MHRPAPFCSPHISDGMPGFGHKLMCCVMSVDGGGPASFPQEVFFLRRIGPVLHLAAVPFVTKLTHWQSQRPLSSVSFGYAKIGEDVWNPCLPRFLLPLPTPMTLFKLHALSRCPYLPPRSLLWRGVLMSSKIGLTTAIQH